MKATTIADILDRLADLVGGDGLAATFAVIAAIGVAACFYSGHRAWRLAQDGDPQGDSGSWLRIGIAFAVSALLGIISVCCGALALVLIGS